MRGLLDLPPQIRKVIAEFVRLKEKEAEERGHARGKADAAAEVAAGLKALSCLMPGMAQTPTPLPPVPLPSPTAVVAVASEPEVMLDCDDAVMMGLEEAAGAVSLSGVMDDLFGSAEWSDLDRQELLRFVMASVTEAMAAKGRDPEPVLAVLREMAVDPVAFDAAMDGEADVWMSWQAMPLPNPRGQYRFKAEDSETGQRKYGQKAIDVMRQKNLDRFAFAAGQGMPFESGDERTLMEHTEAYRKARESVAALRESLAAGTPPRPGDLLAYTDYLPLLTAGELKGLRAMLAQSLTKRVRAGKSKADRVAGVSQALARLREAAATITKAVLAHADAGGEASKRAVIVKGNPKFVDDNAAADAFYRQLSATLEGLGYTVVFDAGEPHTEPPAADLWVGHSRGADRLRFAPPGTRTVAIGSNEPGSINNPDDDAMRDGQVPTAAHFTLTPSMVEELRSRVLNTGGEDEGQLVHEAEFDPAEFADDEVHLAVTPADAGEPKKPSRLEAMRAAIAAKGSSPKPPPAKPAPTPSPVEAAAPAPAPVKAAAPPPPPKSPPPPPAAATATPSPVTPAAPKPSAPAPLASAFPSPASPQLGGNRVSAKFDTPAHELPADEFVQSAGDSGAIPSPLSDEPLDTADTERRSIQVVPHPKELAKGLWGDDVESGRGRDAARYRQGRYLAENLGFNKSLLFASAVARQGMIDKLGEPDGNREALLRAIAVADRSAFGLLGDDPDDVRREVTEMAGEIRNEHGNTMASSEARRAVQALARAISYGSMGDGVAPSDHGVAHGPDGDAVVVATRFDGLQPLAYRALSDALAGHEDVAYHDGREALGNRALGPRSAHPDNPQAASARKFQTDLVRLFLPPNTRGGRLDETCRDLIARAVDDYFQTGAMPTLPILADAMEEAGFNSNDPELAHRLSVLRGEVPGVQMPIGAWPLTPDVYKAAVAGHAVPAGDARSESEYAEVTPTHALPDGVKPFGGIVPLFSAGSPNAGHLERQLAGPFYSRTEAESAARRMLAGRDFNDGTAVVSMGDGTYSVMWGRPVEINFSTPPGGGD